MDHHHNSLGDVHMQDDLEPADILDASHLIEESNLSKYDYTDGRDGGGFGQQLLEEEIHRTGRIPSFLQHLHPYLSKYPEDTPAANRSMAVDNSHIGHSPSPVRPSQHLSTSKPLSRNASDASYSSGFNTDASQGHEPPATRPSSPAPPGLLGDMTHGRNNRHISVPPQSRTSSASAIGSRSNAPSAKNFRSRSAAPDLICGPTSSSRLLSPRARRLASSPYDSSSRPQNYVSYSPPLTLLI